MTWLSHMRAWSLQCRPKARWKTGIFELVEMPHPAEKPSKDNTRQFRSSDRHQGVAQLRVVKGWAISLALVEMTWSGGIKTAWLAFVLSLKPNDVLSLSRRVQSVSSRVNGELISSKMCFNLLPIAWLPLFFFELSYRIWALLVVFSHSRVSWLDGNGV